MSAAYVNKTKSMKMDVGTPTDSSKNLDIENNENIPCSIDSPEEKPLLIYKNRDDNNQAKYKEEIADSACSLEDPNNLFSPKECLLIQSDFQVPGCSEGVSIYETPHSQKPVRPVVREKTDCISTPEKVFKTPIPLLPWADSGEVWQNMIYKEEDTCKQRSYKVFKSRATYLPRMRAILLDWIMEVCEVYRLRRNTYYLAVDYIDRYLTSNPTVPKTHLQLLGISCVYIAAKLDEIYPPKLTEFSYVCDGACTENEIIKCESLLLTSLCWDVNPMTPTGWLNLFMQLHHNSEFVRSQKLTVHDDSHFQYPQYSSYQFVRASQLMDLFSMDPGFLRFNYSMVAASAMYYLYGKSIALTVSGIPWEELKKCVEYMSIFCYTISTENDPRLLSILVDEQDDRLEQSFKFVKRYVPNIVADENHAIQTHLINLDYFEKSIVHRLESYGLDVTKVYLKKPKATGEPPKSDELSESENVLKEELPTNEENPTNEELESNEELPTNKELSKEKLTTKEAPKDGPVVVMYEIIPSKRATQIGTTEQLVLHPTDPDFKAGQVNVFNLPHRSTVTFDDILNSIYNDMPALETVELFIERK